MGEIFSCRWIYLEIYLKFIIMDYKEKYEQSLARAKEQLDGAKVFDYDNEQIAHDIKTTVYNIFPELKESESKGKRIRKKLIELFHDIVSNDEIFSDYGLDKTEVLAWLEKQSDKPQDKSALEAINEEEVNNADKVEAKFKIGDWVVYNRTDHSREVMQIYDIRDNRYYFNDNTHFSWSVKECDEKSHLWSIKEAKEGDVLATESGKPFIFKGFLDKLRPNSPVACCGIDNSDNFYVGASTNRWTDGKVYPATQEQCDTLFARMKEEGYQ